MATAPHKWWLLIHQIPPKPPYLRTKIAKRLSRLGAVPVKNSVYVLPATDDTLEDLEWVRKEVVAGGGEAFVVEGRFVQGLTEVETEMLFRTARDADYHALADELRPTIAATKRRKKLDDAARADITALIERARKRFERDRRDRLLLGVGPRGSRRSARRAVRAPSQGATEPRRSSSTFADYRRRTWVTRQDIHVDRIASAWLIRRFIDPEARFKFVPARATSRATASCASTCSTPSSRTRATSARSRCSSSASGCASAALRAIAEIVHDIDLKDGKFARREAEGVASVITALAGSAKDDDDRVARGSALFEDLHKHYARD